MNTLLSASLSAGKIALIVGIAVAIIALAAGITILVVKFKKSAGEREKKKLGAYGEKMVAKVIGKSKKGEKYRAGYLSSRQKIGREI